VVAEKMMLRESVASEMEVDYPLPLRQLRFQSTYHDPSQSFPRHFCDPLPMYPQPDPHPPIAFIENKGLTVIRPSGQPSGRSLFLRNFKLALRCLLARVRLAVFKDLCVACTLRCCRILADLSERIKSELRKCYLHPSAFLMATNLAVVLTVLA